MSTLCFQDPEGHGVSEDLPPCIWPLLWRVCAGHIQRGNSAQRDVLWWRYNQFIYIKWWQMILSDGLIKFPHVQDLKLNTQHFRTCFLYKTFLFLKRNVTVDMFSGCLMPVLFSRSTLLHCSVCTHCVSRRWQSLPAWQRLVEQNELVLKARHFSICLVRIGWMSLPVNHMHSQVNYAVPEVEGHL